ncbi:MAG TPA: hypothetical protein VGK20_13010 [Candidatus Binatia bacterium]
MTADRNYRYVAEYLTEDGVDLGTMGLGPDFGPAYECCHLAGVRAGLLSSTAALPPGGIVPVWADEAGAPYVRSLRVSMEAERGDDPVVVDLVASHYLRAAVRRGATRLVEQGRIAAGAFYRSCITAYAVRGESSRSTVSAVDSGDSQGRDGELAFEMSSDEDAVPIVPRPLESLLAGAGPDDADPCPVVVHSVVGRDLLRLAAAAGENECGAGLLGHLARDERSGRIFVEVTALAPVRGGVSERRSFVFTDESWASIHEIAALRGRGELLCGYAHSHPNFCAKCAPEKQAGCAAARPFFSEDDVHLQRTCFPKAWQVALLASDLPSEGRVLNLFGWQDGVVTARPFLTVAETSTDIVTPPAASNDELQGAHP